jgi:fructokinase
VSVLVAGEALIDLVHERDGSVTPHPGGGPFNAARTVARLEQPVTYLGALSTDRFGDRLADQLRSDGVAMADVDRSPAPTTLAVAELGPGGDTRYRFYLEGTAAAGLEADAALAAIPEAVDSVLVGTLALVMEPVAEAVEAVVDRLAGDALVAVDPNCRPSAIRDEARYRERLGRVLAKADLLKLSLDDLAWLRPGCEPVPGVRALMEGGPRAALLTLGAEGAVVVTTTADVAVAAPEVEVVDTIGAGDAFIGGFLAWWRSRDLARGDLDDLDTLRAGAAFATAVSALTCQRQGADPPALGELPSGLV